MNILLTIILLLSSGLAYAANVHTIHLMNATAVIATYIAFCGWIFWRHKKYANPKLFDSKFLGKEQLSSAENSILIAYASQTGNAEQLAYKTAESLKLANLSIELLPLSAIDTAMLNRYSRALFVVSTTGEGDAPDNAVDFLQKVMLEDTRLSHLEYGVLALGDTSYTHFCGFGHTLDTWLQHTYATPMFDMVEVDRNDDGALRHWQYQLSVLAKDTEMADWKTPEYQYWQLSARTLLNPGSAGAPVYHLKLTTSQQALHWQAGDIVEIGPQNAQASIDTFLQRLKLDGTLRIGDEGITLAEALGNKLLPHASIDFEQLAHMDSAAVLATLKTLPHREYSIASIPQDGGLELVIRQTHYADGRLGIGSGWLTEHAALDQDIAVRIRENTAFHPPNSDIPLILIGNGTGIAGLRAHLKLRAKQGQQDAWLIFGERNVAHDFYFKDELNHWRQQGVLTRLDTAFSRDQEKRIYVQDVIHSASVDIAQWVSQGAAIYVCGSANGMAPAVHQTLVAALGEDTLSALHANGRYRRDVY